MCIRDRDIGSSIADGIAKGLGNALGKDGGVQDILNGLNKMCIRDRR